MPPLPPSSGLALFRQGVQRQAIIQAVNNSRAPLNSAERTAVQAIKPHWCAAAGIDASPAGPRTTMTHQHIYDFHLPTSVSSITQGINQSTIETASEGDNDDVHSTSSSCRPAATTSFTSRTPAAAGKRYTTEQLAAIINPIKLKHRSALKLEAWQRYSYKAEFDAYKQSVYHSMPRLYTHSTPSSPQSKPLVSATVDQIHCKEVSTADFINTYEVPLQPCVIRGCMDSWPCYTGADRWTLDYQAGADSKFRNVKVKAGEDDSGYSTKLKLKYMRDYMLDNDDDSPLYVFDSAGFDKAVGDENSLRSLLDHYTVPDYFKADLFNYVNESRRPPYRWVLLGPERSGSSLHVDPLGTSAWNSLISGAKLWILFPPTVSKAAAKGDHLRISSEDNEAITYFMRVVPRIKQEEQQRIDRGEPPQLGVREFIQYPGDTVYVPGGWWHAVLNLEPSIAVTQNFCSASNFDRVWLHARSARKHMAARWLNELKLHEPQIAERAIALNQRDKFEFQFSSKEEKAARKAKKADKELKKKQQQLSAAGIVQPAAPAVVTAAPSTQAELTKSHMSAKKRKTHS